MKKCPICGCPDFFTKEPYWRQCCEHLEPILPLEVNEKKNNLNGFRKFLCLIGWHDYEEKYPDLICRFCGDVFYKEKE